MWRSSCIVLDFENFRPLRLKNWKANKNILFTFFFWFFFALRRTKPDWGEMETERKKASGSEKKKKKKKKKKKSLLLDKSSELTSEFFFSSYIRGSHKRLWVLRWRKWSERDKNESIMNFDFAIYEAYAAPNHLVTLNSEHGSCGQKKNQAG